LYIAVPATINSARGIDAKRIATDSTAKSKGLKTGLATNGTLISTDNAKLISEIFRSVQISIDGPKIIHNKIRGKDNAYQMAVNAIKLLKENDCRQVIISSVVTPKNSNYLNEILKIAKQLQVDSWKITSVMPIGKVNDNSNLYLNEDEFKALLRFVKKNKKEIEIELGENLGFLGRFEKEVRNDSFFCPVGFLACCLGVNGNIRGCPEQPDIDYFIEGNIIDQDFKTIWEKGFKKYRNREFLLDDDCAKCQYKNLCRGGCWVMKTKKIHCSVNRYCL